MRKVYLFFAGTLLSTAALQAQQTEEIEITTANNSPQQLNGYLFAYPTFRPGVAFFRNGKGGKGLFNYSHINNEVLFINSKNDTLALTNEGELSFVTIATDTFFFSKDKFLQQVGSYGHLRLAASKLIQEDGRKRKGAYGETIDGAQVNLTALYVTKQPLVQLTGNDKVVLKKVSTYFIGNENNRFLPLNRENLLKQVREKQVPLLKQYLQEQAVDFTRLEEVQRLLTAITVAG